MCPACVRTENRPDTTVRHAIGTRAIGLPHGLHRLRTCQRTRTSHPRVCSHCGIRNVQTVRQTHPPSGKVPAGSIRSAVRRQSTADTRRTRRPCVPDALIVSESLFFVTVRNGRQVIFVTLSNGRHVVGRLFRCPVPPLSRSPYLPIPCPVRPPKAQKCPGPCIRTGAHS